jgi:fatty acid desaturase
VFEEARSSTDRPHEHLYTRIHGKWYDLASFEHPGGPIALYLIKDRDGSALFESHHLLSSRTKLCGVLSKYEVNELKATARLCTALDARDDGGHYEWEGFEDDPFVQDIKHVLHSYFFQIANARGITMYEATKATPERWGMIIFLMASFFITLPYFVEGCWWTLVLVPQLAFVTTVNYWHDGLHFSLSPDWRVNAILPYMFPFGMSSPWLWYHQHIIGHHVHTNVGHRDPDLGHGRQLMRDHESIEWNRMHLKQASLGRIALLWGMSVTIALQIWNDLRCNAKLSYNNAVTYAKLPTMRLVAHVLGRVFFVASRFVWPFFMFPAGKALIWVIFPSATFGWMFMLNTQVNHLTESCCSYSSPNFWKHQVATAQNFGAESTWCFWLSGGLNYQIEHHLFPSINHCHLPYLAPKVKDVCMQHGVPYNEATGYVDAWKSHIKHISALGQNPLHNSLRRLDMAGKSTAHKD